MNNIDVTDEELLVLNVTSYMGDAGQHFTDSLKPSVHQAMLSCKRKGLLEPRIVDGDPKIFLTEQGWKVVKHYNPITINDDVLMVKKPWWKIW